MLCVDLPLVQQFSKNNNNNNNKNLSLKYNSKSEQCFFGSFKKNQNQNENQTSDLVFLHLLIYTSKDYLKMYVENVKM